MGIIIWLIVGGIIGWLASLIMKTDAQHPADPAAQEGADDADDDVQEDALLGVGGDINSGDFSLSGLLMSLVGAVVLLAIVNLFRRGRVR